MIIAIDGPAGSGKSTIAKSLAKKLGFSHLNSGQIFRALTAKCLDLGLFDKGEEVMEQFVQTCDIRCFEQNTTIHWAIDHTDVTDQLTDAPIVQYVSKLAALSFVRKRSKDWQRAWIVGKKAVVEGRDIGSSVFPAAEVKVYLTASSKVRAERRWNQLKKEGKLDKTSTLLEIEIELMRRDRLDSDRQLDPLICPKGAICLDTTHLGEKAIVMYLYEKIMEKLSAQ